MSKYISQINNTNFVYPNYDLAEYDVEYIHTINNNSISGFVTSFSAVTVASTGMTLNLNATWVKNNADVFIRNTNVLSYLSIHGMTPNQNYYKPWRVINSASNNSLTATTLTFNQNFTVTPSQFGVASFTTGVYYFEIRFIGATSIFPVCRTLSITVP